MALVGAGDELLTTASIRDLFGGDRVVLGTRHHPLGRALEHLGVTGESA